MRDARKKQQRPASSLLWISDTLRILVTLGIGPPPWGDSSRSRAEWEELEVLTAPLSV